MKKKEKCKEENKMNFKKIFAILLIAAFIASIAAVMPIPQVQAQTTPTLKTYPIIDAIPNPIGVGQVTLIKMGILQQLGSVNYGWTGITVTVTKPDGTNQTLGPFTTDSTGSTYTQFTPTEVGTYKLTTNFPEQPSPLTFTSSESGATITKGTIMKASTATMNMTVQQDPLPFYPGHALPTDYWSRPIDPQLREWYSISGNWVQRPDNSLALYNDDAPETAHVLWAHPITTGGLMGGLWGDGQVPSSAEAGDAYEGKFPGAVILNGILYYQRTDTRQEKAPAIIQVDLHTGEQSMFRNTTTLSFGQIFYFNSYNYDGTYSYIWDTTGRVADDPSTPNVNEGYTYWSAFDPFTGNEQMRIANVPSGTRFFGPSGEILILQIDYTRGWMALWNSTDCGLQNAVIGTPDYGSWGNTAHGNALSNPSRYPGLNGTNPRSYTWNATIPTGLTPTSGIGGAALKIYIEDRIVGMQFNRTDVRVWSLDISKGHEGAVLFDKHWTPPTEWSEGSNTLAYTQATNYVKDSTYGNGVIGVWDKELRTHYAFSVIDGSYLWATNSEIYLDAYGWGNAEHTWYFAYGKLYSVGVGGILYAYDLSTGKTAWTYTMSDPYKEPVTGENWWGWIDIIADGKIYIGTLEHSAEQPVPRGGPFVCINATDGSQIWRENGMFRQTRWGGNGIIGDSIIATMDTYDQQVWAIGKGPTELTVTASPKVTVQGSSILVEGMVTDTSPGTNDNSMKTRFPNGVPAVSDESQSEWMLYVYKQFDRPSNATGVPVIIDVIDANGNSRNIGTTTSDANGVYSLNWTPDIPGKYTVYVTFAGSKAYWGSFAQSAFVIDAAPDVTTAPVIEQTQSAADLYFVPAIIGLFIAIVAVGLMTVLVLRKRPQIP
jgi:hypothetical protein